MTQSRLLEVAKNILNQKKPFDRNLDFNGSLIVNFLNAADTVPIEIGSDFLQALRELQSSISEGEGAVLTSSALTPALSTIYPTSEVSSSEQSGLHHVKGGHSYFYG